MNKRQIGWQSALLIGLGCLQMVGDVLALPALKGLGVALHVSPAPKVFTTQNGYETYSPEFFVTAAAGSDAARTVRLTPAINKRVAGPYNRRNAYGAVLSYGPVLSGDERTAAMFESAVLFGFCDAGIAQEIGLPSSERYRIDIRTRQQQIDYPTRFAISCGPAPSVVAL
ncbi:MAG: hypothetical protein AAF513_01255 [Pseudomonadota bacterium]